MSIITNPVLDTDEMLRVGQALEALGYRIIPILKGQKHSGIIGWQNLVATRALIGEWVKSGRYGGWGVMGLGGIDADIYNEDAALAFNRCVPKGLPPRVGRRPKVLYVCTNPENLTKRVSSGYLDADGKVNKVEFLGNGQQFVTWGDHPETGKPYKYSSAKALHDTPMSDLSPITAEQIDAMIKHFDEVVAPPLVANGTWTFIQKANSGDANNVLRTTEFENVVKAVSPGNFTHAQVITALKALNPDCDHNEWVEVGMALHHQYQGSDDGLDIFDQWSASQDSMKYQPGICEQRWPSFVPDASRNSITFSSIFQRAKNATRSDADLYAQNKLENPHSADLFATRKEHRELKAFTLGAGFDASKIPPRQWVFGKRFLRGYLTATVGRAGVSKSTFSILTCLSVALNKSLTGETVHKEGGQVLIINNEDQKHEIERRFAAACLHYDIDFADVEDRFHYLSGYDAETFTICTRDELGVILTTPNVPALIDYIIKHNIVMLVMDPFISTHTANENDNGEIERVMDAYRHIAAKTNCAIELIHHVRKGGEAGDAEASRGASSAVAACRNVTTLYKMTRKEAEQLHIDYDTLGIYLVRMDIGKENFAISAAGATWFKLCSVILPNGEPGELGDDMGVHQPYDVTVHAQEAEEVNVAQRSEILAKRRLDILNAVGGEFNGRLSELYGQLGDMWGIKSRQSIFDRVGTAVGLGESKSVLVETGVGVFKLWRDQRGKTSPTTIHIAKFQA